MGRLYTRFQFDSCDTFWIIAQKWQWPQNWSRDPQTDPMTPKCICILAEPRQVSVPSFKLIALKLLELSPSDPQIDRFTPKMKRDLVPSTMSVCTKFQDDSSRTFGVMLQKPDLTFLTSVTLKINVTTPKWIWFFRGIWGSYTPCVKLIAVKLFALLHGNDVQTDGQRHNIIRPMGV